MDPHDSDEIQQVSQRMMGRYGELEQQISQEGRDEIALNEFDKQKASTLFDHKGRRWLDKSRSDRHLPTYKKYDVNALNQSQFSTVKSNNQYRQSVVTRRSSAIGGSVHRRMYSNQKKKIDIKIKIYKKKFTNIDLDERSQKHALQTFKSIKIQNQQLFQKPEDIKPIVPQNEFKIIKIRQKPKVPNERQPKLVRVEQHRAQDGQSDLRQPSSGPSFQGHFHTILNYKNNKQYVSNILNTQAPKPPTAPQAQTPQNRPKKSIFSFNSRDKRFSEPIDDLFQRRYSSPGPGYYEQNRGSLNADMEKLQVENTKLKTRQEIIQSRQSPLGRFPSYQKVDTIKNKYPPVDLEIASNKRQNDGKNRKKVGPPVKYKKSLGSAVNDVKVGIDALVVGEFLPSIDQIFV